MRPAFVHRTTSESPQKRTGDFSPEHNPASRTLLWAGHVARMPMNLLPKRLMLSWIREPRVAGSQEVTYGRSLQRHLNRFGLPAVFAKWAYLAQDRAGWHKPVTTPPFAIGKPFVWQSRDDIGVTPEDKRQAVAQCAAEITERRVAFDAKNSN